MSLLINDAVNAEASLSFSFTCTEGVRNIILPGMISVHSYIIISLDSLQAESYISYIKYSKGDGHSAGNTAMKKMILVTSPPACGKTYISKELAKNLKHVVYLDKDTLIPLSNRVFAAAGEEINRSSQFFEENIRDFEYEVIVDLGVEALEYDDIVLINAPFTEEVHNEETMETFRTKLRRKGAKLVIVWVVTDPEVCHQRMIDRNSDRDTWKLEHWDEYIKTVDFSIPEPLKQLDSGHDLVLFYNSSDEEFTNSMKEVLPKLEE